MKKKIENFTFWVMAFILFAALIIVYKTFDNFSSVLGAVGIIFIAMRPFFIAFVIAYIVNLPMVRFDAFLRSRKNKLLNAHSRGIAILAAYFLTVGVLAIIVGAVVPALYNNLYDFYANSSSYFETARDYIKNSELLRRFDILQNLDSLDIPEEISSFLKRIDMSQMQKYAVGLFSATTGLISAIVSIIASVYMLIEKNNIIASCKRIICAFVKEELVDNVMRYMNKINDIFTSYVYSRLVCCLVMGVICSIVLSIMQVKYAIVLGMFIGLCDLIPYFGSIIGSIIAVLINFLTQGILGAVWVGIALVILQQLDGNVLAPKIMGRSLEISPLLTVFAVVVGGNLFGVAGMIFSVPIVAIIKEIAVDIISYYERKRKTSKENLG